MNKVELLRLTLKNFKGLKELAVDFGNVTTISGENGTGKTTVFDAFTWCLFGKDSAGRTDSGRGSFTIKTVDATGRPIEKLEHTVTAVLSLNGSEVELTRSLVEDWVKPRGKAEVELKGNTTHYYVNGVEVKAGQYQAKVTELIDEQLFKLITSPAYFPSLDWQAQRNILMTIAGGVTFEEVAAGREDFIAIVAKLSGKDMAAYKAEIAYRKGVVKKEQDKCPVEINAITSVTPQAPDYAALETEKATLSAKLEDVEKQIIDIAETTRKNYQQAQERQRKINELKTQQNEVVFAARQKKQSQGYEANAHRNELIVKLSAKQRESDNYDTIEAREKADLERRIKENNEKIAGLQQQRTAKLTEWENRNAEEYRASSEGLICPIYRTLCSDASVLKTDAEAKTKAKAAFEQAKEAELTRITSEGKAINAQIKDAEKYGAELTQQLTQHNDTAKQKKQEYANEIAKLSAELERTPEVIISTDVNPADLPEWQALEAQITAIPAPTEDGTAANTSELIAKKNDLNTQINSINAKLNLRVVIENNEKKVAEIKARERELAQQLADLEKEEFTADALNKARMDEVERRVNGLFQNVRFRMYERQLNGGEVPTCVASVNGVKYSDLNTAGKINAGLDIINTLGLYHGISAPVFIDNSESVNNLFPITSQLIKLRVSTDKELSINQL
ncbi:MAG: AAA family ATPase [Clostridia bacterium]|nr:AAA family ATPase [Clostridia bacterium]